MYFTGFADEAAKGIDGQIQATLDLGWKNIEARAIDGVNIHDLDDAAFDAVAGKLEAAGVHINCFGSAIANWGKSIEKEEDFQKDLEQTRRAIPRMQRLGTHLVRIMSYAVLEDRSPEDQFREKRIQRLREIVDLFLEAGIQPVHENCMNYGGMGWSYTLDLIDNVPGLKLVFDTGNPVFNKDRTKMPSRIAGRAMATSSAFSTMPLPAATTAAFPLSRISVPSSTIRASSRMPPSPWPCIMNMDSASRKSSPRRSVWRNKRTEAASSARPWL